MDATVNIGPRERRKRLIMGVVTLGVSGAIALTLILADVGRWWRIGLFFPFWLGALGVFQARENT